MSTDFDDPEEPGDAFEEFVRWKMAQHTARFRGGISSPPEVHPVPLEPSVRAPTARSSAPTLDRAHRHVSVRSVDKLRREPTRAVLTRDTPLPSFLKELYEARWRIAAAGAFFGALTVLFCVVATQTFWAPLMRWQTWVTLFTLITLISCLILEMWDVTLSFFGANCVLVYAGVITLDEALRGFSNASIVAIGAMFVLAVALEKTLILDWVVRNVLRQPTSLRNALLRVLPACGVLSAFTNNTPIVAIMVRTWSGREVCTKIQSALFNQIPVLGTWSIRAQIPVSQLLMPMSFAVIVGGLCTIIGTSTNLVIQGLADTIPGVNIELGFFEVGALGAPFLVLGLIYLITLGPFLLPSVSKNRTYVPRVFVWQRVPRQSPHLGTPLMDSKLVKVPGAEPVWVKPVDVDSVATSTFSMKVRGRECALRRRSSEYLLRSNSRRA